MWRVTQRVHFPKSLCSPCKKKTYPRWKSTVSSRSSGGGGKFLVVIGTTALLGVGGTVAYAKYDSNFRKTVEDAVPYADVILRSIPDWGNAPSVPQTEEKPLSEKIREKAEYMGLVKKQQERLNRKESTSSLPPQQLPQPLPPPPPPPPPPQSLDSPEQSQKPPAAPAIKEEKKLSKREVDELNIKERLAQQEANAAAQNAALKKSIREGMDKIEILTKEAILAQQEAILNVKQHIEKLYKALDTTEEGHAAELWNVANVANESRMASTKKAAQLASKARLGIQKLKNTVERGKESVITAQNENLLPAEEVINKALYQLQRAETEVAEALADAKIVDDYKSMVDRSKQQFQKELSAIMPEVKTGIKGNKLTEEELNFLIAHAHRRVEQLQKQLARQEVSEQRHIHEALQRQKEEDEKVAGNRIAVELSKHEREMEIAFQKRVEVLQEEFEHGLRQQLRRQAAAHSDHIRDVLQVQQQDLDYKHMMKMEEKLLEQQGMFNSELSGNMKKLDGIESYLKAREELDQSAKKSQEMWLACQAMKHTIKVGDSDHDSEPKPLSKEIAAVKDAAEDGNAFVAVVLSSIPSEALARGVYTEEALKERFRNVDRLCKRVAMVDETGGSLYKYFISYLQSFLIIDAVYIPKSELENKVRVDPKEWNTFDILARVRYCIQQDNLEQALRYINQLRGEPRRVAQDWIKEVRLLLETRQAADALIAHAAAVGVQAYH